MYQVIFRFLFIIDINLISNNLISVEKGECNYDSECPDNNACIENQCLDPCIINSPCGNNAICKTTAHRPFCQCPPGLAGDPHSYCYECTYQI